VRAVFAEENEQMFGVKRAFDPAGLLNPGKVIPTLNRCAEYGKMLVRGGQIKAFPELERSVQRGGQVGHGAVDVVPLFQAEQADAEGHEVRPARRTAAARRRRSAGPARNFLLFWISGSVV
jgi:hypothetical protein